MAMANMSLAQVLDHLDHLGKGSMEILLKVLKVWFKPVFLPGDLPITSNTPSLESHPRTWAACWSLILFHFEIASNESSGIFYIKLNLQRLVVLQSPKVPLASFGYSAMA